MRTFTLLGISAIVLQGVAAHGTGWRDQAEYSCPKNTKNDCTPDEKNGFDWSDLAEGKVDKYKGYSFSGWDCASKLGKRNLEGRTFSGKCIETNLSDNDFSNEISCDKSFSIGELDISVDKETDVEFHYGMPDGTTCKQTKKCGTTGTTVTNDQCGGAKTVKVKLPKDKGTKSCKLGIHQVKFECGTTTTSVPVPTTTIPAHSISALHTTAPATGSCTIPKNCTGKTCTMPAGCPSTTGQVKSTAVNSIVSSASVVCTIPSHCTGRTCTMPAGCSSTSGQVKPTAVSSIVSSASVICTIPSHCTGRTCTMPAGCPSTTGQVKPTAASSVSSASVICTIPSHCTGRTCTMPAGCPSTTGQVKPTAVSSIVSSASVICTIPSHCTGRTCTMPAGCPSTTGQVKPTAASSVSSASVVCTIPSHCTGRTCTMPAGCPSTTGQVKPTGVSSSVVSSTAVVCTIPSHCTGKSCTMPAGCASATGGVGPTEVISSAHSTMTAPSGTCTVASDCTGDSCTMPAGCPSATGVAPTDINSSADSTTGVISSAYPSITSPSGTCTIADDCVGDACIMPAGCPSATGVAPTDINNSSADSTTAASQIGEVDATAVTSSAYPSITSPSGTCTIADDCVGDACIMPVGCPSATGGVEPTDINSSADSTITSQIGEVEPTGVISSAYPSITSPSGTCTIADDCVGDACIIPAGCPSATGVAPTEINSSTDSTTIASQIGEVSPTGVISSAVTAPSGTCTIASDCVGDACIMPVGCPLATGVTPTDINSSADSTTAASQIGEVEPTGVISSAYPSITSPSGTCTIADDCVGDACIMPIGCPSATGGVEPTDINSSVDSTTIASQIGEVEPTGVISSAYPSITSPSGTCTIASDCVGDACIMPAGCPSATGVAPTGINTSVDSTTAASQIGEVDATAVTSSAYPTITSPSGTCIITDDCVGDACIMPAGCPSATGVAPTDINSSADSTTAASQIGEVEPTGVISSAYPSITSPSGTCNIDSDCVGAACIMPAGCSSTTDVAPTGINSSVDSTTIASQIGEVSPTGVISSAVTAPSGTCTIASDCVGDACIMPAGCPSATGGVGPTDINSPTSIASEIGDGPTGVISSAYPSITSPSGTCTIASDCVGDACIMPAGCPSATGVVPTGINSSADSTTAASQIGEVDATAVISSAITAPSGTCTIASDCIGDACIMPVGCVINPTGGVQLSTPAVSGTITAPASSGTAPADACSIASDCIGESCIMPVGCVSATGPVGTGSAPLTTLVTESDLSSAVEATSTLASAVITSVPVGSSIGGSYGSVDSSIIGSSGSSAIDAAFTTTASAAVPAVTVPATACPDVLPRCLKTWLFITDCTDSADPTCFCPEEEFVNKVVDCLSSWGADDAEVANSVQYFLGICQSYIPSNPAIITAIPATITLEAPSANVPVQTIIRTLTTVVPCEPTTITTGASSGIIVTVTTSVVTTTIAIPQVTLIVTATDATLVYPTGAVDAVATTPMPSQGVATYVPAQTTAQAASTAVPDISTPSEPATGDAVPSVPSVSDAAPSASDAAPAVSDVAPAASDAAPATAIPGVTAPAITAPSVTEPTPTTMITTSVPKFTLVASPAESDVGAAGNSSLPAVTAPGIPLFTGAASSIVPGTFVAILGAAIAVLLQL